MGHSQEAGIGWSQLRTTSHWQKSNAYMLYKIKMQCTSCYPYFSKSPVTSVVIHHSSSLSSPKMVNFTLILPTVLWPVLKVEHHRLRKDKTLLPVSIIAVGLEASAGRHCAPHSCVLKVSLSLLVLVLLPLPPFLSNYWHVVTYRNMPSSAKPITSLIVSCQVEHRQHSVL